MARVKRALLCPRGARRWKGQRVVTRGGGGSRGPAGRWGVSSVRREGSRSSVVGVEGHVAAATGQGGGPARSIVSGPGKGTTWLARGWQQMVEGAGLTGAARARCGERGPAITLAWRPGQRRGRRFTPETGQTGGEEHGKMWRGNHRGCRSEVPLRGDTGGRPADRRGT